jgi:hypothetical protein
MAKDYFNTLVVVVICSFLSGTSNTATVSSRLKQLKWMKYLLHRTRDVLRFDLDGVTEHKCNNPQSIKQKQHQEDNNKTELCLYASSFLLFDFPHFFAFSSPRSDWICDIWMLTVSLSSLPWFASMTICGPLSKTAVVVAVVAATPRV